MMSGYHYQSHHHRRHLHHDKFNIISGTMVAIAVAMTVAFVVLILATQVIYMLASDVLAVFVFVFWPHRCFRSLLLYLYFDCFV